jgi:hypothetical protein
MYKYLHPWNSIKWLGKGIGFIVALPFMIIAWIFQGVWLLFAGVVSITATALAFVIAVAVIIALVGVPIYVFQQKQTEYFRPDPIVGHDAITSEWVGPHGKRIEIRTTKHGSRRTIWRSGPLVVQVPAEIDSDDFDFGTLSESVVVESKHDHASHEGHVEASCDEPDGGPEVAVVPAVPTPPSWEPRQRPAWVDDLADVSLGAHRLRVDCGPFESREACQAAYQDAVARSVKDYVRARAEICLADLGMTRMPWHELTVQRIAQKLRITPADEFLEVRPTEIGGDSYPYHFKYGLLEMSPAIRGHIDREVTRWARSFQAAEYWGMLLAGLTSIYVFVKVKVLGRVTRLFTKRQHSASAIAS